jgi:opacity protein-like surface antigen
MNWERPRNKMRKFKIIAVLAVLVPSASSAEMAFTDMYVGGFGGTVFGVDADGKNDTLLSSLDVVAKQDFDPDGEFALGLVLGARVAPNFRAEVELSYVNSDVDGTELTFLVPFSTDATGDLSSTSLLLNAWYDFETNSSWRPYVGGGIGYTNVDADVDATEGPANFNDSDGGFSYQIGFGVTFPVGQSGTIDIGYRYRETRNLKLTSAAANGTAVFDDIDFKAQTIQIGYNYRF